MSYLANGPWNKSSNFILSTKYYGIPKKVWSLAIGQVRCDPLILLLVLVILAKYNRLRDTPTPPNQLHWVGPDSQYMGSIYR